MSHTTRITASAADAVTVAGGRLTASATSRTIAGTVVRFGVPGHTSRGRLTVQAGALTFPEDLGNVKLTYEHDRSRSRGHMTSVEHHRDHIRASFRVADGPEGDAALREATDRSRDGLSFDIVDATVVDGTITAGHVVAVGQVGIPAYEHGRIDTIAAANQEGSPTMLTDEQRARLDELLTRTDLDEAETAELNALQVLAGDAADTPPANDAAAADQAATPPAPVAVAASMPAIPSGGPTPAARTRPRRNALASMVADVCEAARREDFPGITAAFTDVTSTQHTTNIEAPAWSAELWSGLQYEPRFTGLLNSGTLTNYEGKGWRWTTKPVMADYAGDKAAVPSAAIATEPSTYEAARMAVGHDFDRKFFDFPNEAFLNSYVEAVRESWAQQLDSKVEAYIIANAAASGVTPGTTLLASLAKLLRYADRARLGRSLFVVLNDNDYDRLFDINNQQLPAFMELTGIDVNRIVASANVPADLAVAGAKQAATVRTLPGSPIRVDAQHLANGGVDRAFFGYWAIEEHHPAGIVSMDLGFVA